MKKRLLALFLAFVMTMSLLPVSVFADGGTGGQLQGTKDDPITASKDGVTVNKYVSQGEGGQYNLTLEAYASNQLTTTTTTTPLDIVLVLDTSGSMKDKLEGTHYKAIADKTEWSFNDVNSYDGTLYCKKGDHYYEVKGDYNWWSNSDYKLQYHAGLLDWKNLTETSDGPDETLYTGELYQRVSGTSKIEAMQAAVNNFIDSVKTNSLKDEKVHHQIGIVEFASDGYIKANLTNVETAADSLKTTVNSFVASGATAVDYALNKASGVLDSARSNAQKVVVLFTDGEPNHGNGFDRKVAATAINEAQELKASGVTIYTIGVFADAKPDDTTGDFNKYMNAVSSRYPQATATGGTDYHDRTLTVDWGKDTEKQYYFAADSAESLDDVFQNIADEVTTGTLTSNPDAGSVLSDTMSQYFKFPEGITTNDVTVQFASAKSYSEKDGFTFNDPGTLPVGVAPTVEVKGDTITITGFDYKGNAASYNKTDKTVSGGKLVVTFPIEINENACNEDTNITDGYYPTNSTAELFHKGSAASTTNDTRTTLSDSPKVSYTKPSFTVTWKSQDGKTTLKTDENVTYGTKPHYDGAAPKKPADDKYTYTFAGWAMQADQESGVAEEKLDKVTGPTTYYAAFSKTEITRYSITINYRDDDGSELKTPHSESQKVGFEYSFDVSKEADTTIPFIIMKDEKQYVFDHFTEDSGALSGELNGNVVITAVYLLDGNRNEVPDAHEATVTYKVVNGTWSDGSTTDKTEKFNLKEFNHTTNAWESANPTLGSTIPTGMQPDGTHVAPGAWDETPTANTRVTGPKTYTYTFNTSVNSKLKVEKTLEKVNVKAYTTGKVEADDVLTYTIKVTNTGNVSLSGIAVTDTFTGSAAPTTTTAAVTWTLDPASNSYKATWNVGELAAGANVTLTYTYTVRAADQGKTITNTAVAASGDTTGSDTNEVTVYNPDMTVTKAVTKVNDTKVDSSKTVEVQKDDVLTYTITVKNTGDQDLTNVVVTDGKWSNGTKIIVSGVDNPVTLISGSYTIGTLNVDETVTITYTYTVTETDVTAGKVTNKVSVTSNETSGGESGGTTTDVVGYYTIKASSGANGSIDPAGSVKVAAGTDKTFTITANAGYHIGDVTVDGVSKGAVSSYTFENVQANHTISVTFDRNTTTRDDYTLHYVTNGGNHLSSETKSYKWTKDYEDLPTPVRDGYTFEGWYWDLRLTEPVTGDVDVNKTTVTLYAKWSEKIGPDDTGVSDWLETDDHNAYLTGYPDSTFRADRNMTRAEVAQMFYALLLDKNVTITKSFSDVPDDAWYATAVKTLASLGMMDGYPDGTFRPDEPITRAEFATVGLAFAYDPLDASCSYYDVGANAWYYTYVAQATTYGWIGGYPDNTFRPGNNITRVEVCVIVNNMLGRDADERYIDRHEDELVHFVDLSDSYWGYYTIMESTNTHEYTGSFTNEKWTDVK